VRFLYNTRATNPDLRRLSFVLIGVATPGDLIRDAQRTPFNVGTRVQLTDFTIEEALPLAAGLDCITSPRQVIKLVLEWTGGHPYLTQRLCRDIILMQPQTKWSKTNISNLAKSIFLSEQSEQDTNLRFVQDMLIERVPKQASVGDVLSVYREILSGTRVFDEEQSIVKSHLKLSGIVREENGMLRVRNRIYESVFNEIWISAHITQGEQLRQFIRKETVKAEKDRVMSTGASTSVRPLCFVVMPFGKKVDSYGLAVDFDAVYEDVFKPAILAAGLEPLRGDDEAIGGIIHKTNYERLILCEFVVADLTTGNANVFYELGVRHAARPSATIIAFATTTRLPFDVGPLRAVPYKLNEDGKPADVEVVRELLGRRLLDARHSTVSDSPLFQLLDDYPDLSHQKTDLFRDRVRYSTEIKEKLATARQHGVEHLHLVQMELGDINSQESSVVIDLLTSYRAVGAWSDMIALVEKMRSAVAGTVLVQEQLAFALNRVGQGERAETVLLHLIEQRGPSSETLNLLGRVYKDRWRAAVKAGKNNEARALLDKAISTYLRGFEADLRDPYPGLNAVTLMSQREPPDPRFDQILPVVAYAIERHLAKSEPDYWDFSARLELAVLAGNKDQALFALNAALSAVRALWEVQTTVDNLQVIREARERQNRAEPWMIEIERALSYVFSP
jgi:tetratricopeptide (TPR) repeat protein